MSSRFSRKELEELRKKKEEEAAAHVFQEFVETFQEAPIKSSKVWIKAGTYDAGARKEDTTERGKVYKPQSRLDTNEKSSTERTQEYVKLLASKPDKPQKRRDKDKKKSNLELFKEELKQIQTEREERHKYKSAIKHQSNSDSPEPEVLAPFMKDDVGSFDYGDPNTTNLYLGNLSPKLTEQQLMEIFGRYGPLASIKIMWPRSEEEKARGRNCGFVAYMSRRDGERALRNLNGKDIMGCEMKMGWGKAVAIPPHPIYIPPVMLSPPPFSGLPFNAQPPRMLQHKIPRLRAGEAFPSDSMDKDTLHKILSQSVVKVVIPKERQTLMLIHRMVEFVIREGPMFEAMIMNKEINNPQFRFLFENQSPNHVYYRWKLFSLLQGDTPKEWSVKEFRMFKGGSIWRPPGMNYTYGMPDELVEEDEFKDTKGTLSKTQRERLEDLIRQLTPERWKVGEAMVFCVEHADAAQEIADCLAESLSMLTTAPSKKAARVFLLSDVLHNCTSKVTNVSNFRKAFEIRLIQIMQDIHESCERQENQTLGEGLRARIQNVLKNWLEWHVYPNDFILKLFNALHGIEIKDDDNEKDSNNANHSSIPLTDIYADVDGEDIDGEEMEEGGPLDGAALLKAAQELHSKNTKAQSLAPIPKGNVFNDIDGIPMEDDIDGVPLEDRTPSTTSGKPPPHPSQVPGFIPSKWETVGAEEEPGWKGEGPGGKEEYGRYDEEEESDDSTNTRTPPPPSMSPDNADSNEVSDERRQLLRSVELKAMQYQDELESGSRKVKAGWTIHQQVQHYRRKLIKRAEREVKEKEDSESPERDSKRYKEKERERERERDSYRSERDKDRDRERERERERERARSVSSDDEYSTSSSRRSRRSREKSYSPARKRYRSRSPVRKSRRRTPTPPPPPVLSSSGSSSYHSSSRKSSETSSRKHKHKHKY